MADLVDRTEKCVVNDQFKHLNLDIPAQQRGSSFGLWPYPPT